jgi:hypothetical protein
MGDASKTFDRVHYSNFYHVLDTLQRELEARKRDIEVSVLLNKVGPRAGTFRT